MTIRIKKVIKTDQWIVFIFVWKLFKRVQLRDTINVIEHNSVITRKIMFWLSLQKKLQVTKLYIIFGSILQLLKVPTVPRYWAKLTNISYKEWRFTATWTIDMHTVSDKNDIATNRILKESCDWYNKAFPTNTCLMSKSKLQNNSQVSTNLLSLSLSSMFYCWLGNCASILETKKIETCESLWRTLDCEYTRCNLDISYNSIINLRCNATATFIISNS